MYWWFRDEEVILLATTPIIDSPKEVRKGSRDYYKEKFESLMKRYEKDVLQNNKESINIAEVPGLLKITSAKP